jgi:hypothetical protein
MNEEVRMMFWELTEEVDRGYTLLPYLWGTSARNKPTLKP